MPNRLLKLVLDPTSVASGTSTTVQFIYESASAGSLTVEPSEGFRVTPTTRDLPAAANGTGSFKLKVTRVDSANKTCGLLFIFFNSDRQKRLSVT